MFFPIDVSIGLLKLRSACARGVRGAQPGNLGRIGASCVNAVCVAPCGCGCVPVAPDRSPSYTNFSQPNIGSKSPKFSRRFAPKYPAERFKNASKSLKFSRRFAPKYPSERFKNASKSLKFYRRFAPKYPLKYHLETFKTTSMGFPA